VNYQYWQWVTAGQHKVTNSLSAGPRHALTAPRVLVSASDAHKLPLGSHSSRWDSERAAGRQQRVPVERDYSVSRRGEAARWPSKATYTGHDVVYSLTVAIQWPTQTRIAPAPPQTPPANMVNVGLTLVTQHNNRLLRSKAHVNKIPTSCFWLNVFRLKKLNKWNFNDIGLVLVSVSSSYVPRSNVNITR